MIYGIPPECDLGHRGFWGLYIQFYAIFCVTCTLWKLASGTKKNKI